ncbi:MAG TPA: phosphoserine phosphatase SerB [Roseiarcus sp.]|nr:phosphoserine phosphatase SerB [Roseiarcus sp.]
MPPVPVVATLVAAPQSFEISDALIARAAQALPRVARPERLAEGAADLFFLSDEAEAARVKDRLAATLAGEAIDVIVQPSAGRRKRLLLADMDSTLIEQECIDELAARAGLGSRVAAITERAMRGEIAFEPALRERVALLAGLPETVIGEVIKARITLSPGARVLAQTMRRAGAYAALVSGGFTQFTGVIAERLGLDEHRANRLIVENGVLTGKAAEPILGADAKLAALRDLAARRGLSLGETLAIGDGANDLAMLSEAGLGVAYRAKPAVAAAAHARIDHADLTALLYAQGYRREEFAA